MRSLIVLMTTALPVLAQPAQTPRTTPPPTQNRQQNPDPARPQRSDEPPVVTTVVDETLSVSKHTITLNGKTLDYTSTTGQMPLKTANGETEAHIFHVAYTLNGVADPATRPVTFAFNGGPGSASIWVHMGCMGPKKAKLLDNGDMPPPPYQRVDNEFTWLDKTDLVFIDPVGTGYSRAKTPDIARRMNGVQGDIQSVGEFIRMYLTRNKRWMSPVFLAGESYGTFRSAGLAGHLIDQGVALNGIVLISTILDYSTTRGTPTHNLPYALFLPTNTADAWYHKKLPSDLQAKDLKTVLKESEAWAMTGYLEALNKGDRMTPDERKKAIATLARYTGLEPRYLDRADLRFDTSLFTRELLRDDRLTIGRLDGRLTGPSPRNGGERSEFDPSSTLIRPPYQATFLDYLSGELGYKSDMVYHVSGGTMAWDYGSQNRFVETADLLRTAFAKNPHLKVLVTSGYYDLATPYFAAEYTFNHMGLTPEALKNVSWKYYPAGHMMYIDRESHRQMTRDVGEFLNASTPRP